jgi:hypothetical protein
MKLPQILFALCLTASLLSCEGGTTFTKTLVNRSDVAVTLRTTETIAAFTDSFTVQPQTSQTIYFSDRMGLFVTDLYPCLSEFDSLFVELPDTLVLLKNILDESNWEKELTGGRNAQAICTFVIEAGDIQ